MDTFSWKDGVQATVGACLPCFACVQQTRGDEQSDNEERGGRTRYAHYDELEGLLGDTQSDAERDAETLSLHSNVGSGVHKKRKKKRSRWSTKSVQLFGFHLFGRPTPPIYLAESDSEEDDAEGLARRRQRLGRIASAHSSSSTSAFDADAAPLDAAAIAGLSAQEAGARAESAAAAHAEESRRRMEERAEREERRRKRQERKELRRAAAALALGGDEEFEGFQGSGSGGSAPPSLLATARNGSVPSSPAAVEEFGPYVNGHNNGVGAILGGRTDDTDAADGDADFGGAVYTRPVRSRGSNSGSSRSQTSASHSNAGSGSGSLPSSPFASRFSTASTTLPQVPSERKGPGRNLRPHEPKSTSNASTSNTSSSPTASPSLGSPVQPSFGFAHPHPHVVGRDSDSEAAPAQLGVSPIQAFNSVRKDAVGFPSVGFGGVRRTNSSGLGSGVFLARMGDE